MDYETAIEAEVFIQEVLAIASPNLDSSVISFVNHYLQHDEYEMAFEGLFISLMECAIVPDINWHKSVEIAQKLRLNIESIYDVKFWENFSKYVEDKI